jgi:hypothetical protein
MSFLKNIIFLFLCSYLYISVTAQTWPVVYGAEIDANVSNVIENYDRGYIICGWIYKNPNFTNYGWIIKTDVNGNILWDKKYGNGDYGMYFSDVKNTNNNGLIISGATGKYDNLTTFDAAFYKLNHCGESEWCQVLRSPGDNYGTGIIQLNDGTYIGMLMYLGGDMENIRISLVKMNQSGEPLWIQNLAQGDSLINNEEGGYLYLTNEQNFLVSGQCFHPGLKPFWILTDSSGYQIWDLIWSGGQGGAYQVVENYNNYFYSAGALANNGLPFTPSIFKFDNFGNPIFMKYLMGDSINGGEAKSLCNYNDSLLLTGITWGTSTFPTTNYYSEILKLDTLGNILSRKLLLNEAHAPQSIIRTFDNKIIVSGHYVVNVTWDIYMWKLNSDLEIDTFYTQPLTYDSLCPHQILSDTVDLDCSLFVNIDEIPTKEEYESTLKISPNPAKDWIALSLPDNVCSGDIEIAVYNIFGQEIMKSSVVPQNRVFSLNVSSLSSGLYLAVCQDAKRKVFKGKFIVAR